MVKEKKPKKSTKKKSEKKKTAKNSSSKDSKKSSKKTESKKPKKNIPTLNLKTYDEVATDFGVKVYQKFDKIIKSIILFGSVAEKDIELGSDIDIIIIVDDVSISWDTELIAWYRGELEKIINSNPYKGSLHINTIKLSTWWDDLIKGDPVVLNVLRSGESIIDYGGFFEPLKYLLIKGKIKGTPEAIYQCMQRAPSHLARSKASELNAVEGIYWTFVDSAHGALIAARYFPPTPEHAITDIKEAFVDKKVLKDKYLNWYKEIYYLHKKIDRGEISDPKDINLDMWQKRAEEFFKVMLDLVKRIVM
jgi:predicted nucleotidyltransferase